MSKRRKLLILLSVLIVSMSCVALFLSIKSRKTAVHVAETSDFETLMGKGLPLWEYVQTRDDFENLHFFKRLFEINKTLAQETSSSKIPHTLHFIWLGPNPFPRESVENVRSWMGKHPGWTAKFWTDRERPLPCPGMELKLVRDFHFQSLKECFNKSDNYGEKSDVLRYEILFQEGGVYVDHDVKCFKAFDSFNKNYDFYCGMDMPFKSSLPSCIFPTNNLIGIAPEHPILKTCIQNLKSNWDEIQEQYPGVTRDEVLNRVLHRTFYLFGQAIKQSSNQEGRRDIVFPAFYFDAPSEDRALWAYHFYSGKWHEEESKFEKMVRERLMTITKKTNKLLLVIGVLSGINLVGLVSMVLLFRKRHAH